MIKVGCYFGECFNKTTLQFIVVFEYAFYNSDSPNFWLQLEGILLIRIGVRFLADIATYSI